jgi:hypothetical protein
MSTTPKATRKFISDLVNKYFGLFNDEQNRYVFEFLKQAYKAGYEDGKKENNATPLLNLSSPKISKRLPLEKQQPVHKFVYLIEDLLKTRIVNWGKQCKAMKMLQNAGYNEKDIETVIRDMASTDFFKEKSYDLMTVANVIDKVIVRIREKEKKNAWQYTT